MGFFRTAVSTSCVSILAVAVRAELAAGSADAATAPCDQNSDCAGVESNSLLTIAKYRQPTSTSGTLQDMLRDHCNSSSRLRVRTEIREVDAAQWERLKGAWRLLATKDSPLYDNQPLYDYMGWRHQQNNTLGHKTYTFLPYHRALTLDLENMVRNIAKNSGDQDACNMTLPFWDWTDHNMTAILNAQYLGTTATGKRTQCVQDGLAGGFSTPENWLHGKWRGWAKIENGRSCVERKSKVNTKGLSNAETMYGLREQQDLGTFNKDLQKLHNTLHGNIGGNMANRVTGHSASDPLFFFHHNFIDYLWFRWQKYAVLHGTGYYVTDWQGKTTEEYEAATVDDAMLRDAGQYVSPYKQDLDCVEVPGSSQDLQNTICLRYQDTQWAIKEQPWPKPNSNATLAPTSTSNGTLAPTSTSNGTLAPTSTSGTLQDMLRDHCNSSSRLRVRTEIREVDAAQWERLKGAWRLLATKDSPLYDNQPLYDYMGSRHQQNEKLGHKTYTFLPYHRALTLDLENMVRNIAKKSGDQDACNMTLPFWDWTDHNMTAILNAQYLGTTNTTGCVQDGLAGGFSTPAHWLDEKHPWYKDSKFENNRSCVMRNEPVNTNGMLMTEKMYSSRDQKRLDKFNKDLQKWHKQFHWKVGGNMGWRVGAHSTSDPIFFFHHNFIDYLWFRWQKYAVLHGTGYSVTDWHNQITTEYNNAGVDDAMLQDAGYWVSPYKKDMDCVDVPGSSQDVTNTICLRYQDTKWAIKEQPWKMVS